MIMKFFVKKDVPKAAAAEAEPWPWPTIEEGHVRGLIKARQRFITNSGQPMNPESPDLSSALVEMGKSLPQRMTLRRIWREELFKVTEANAKAAAKPQQSEWFD